MRIGYINLWKKDGFDIQLMWRAPSQNVFNGVSRRESPFTRQFSDPKWAKMDQRTFCNFWTIWTTDDHNTSKWPELLQDFKFFIKKVFFLKLAACCPINCSPRPNGFGAGALHIMSWISNPNFFHMFIYVSHTHVLSTGAIILDHF